MGQTIGRITVKGDVLPFTLLPGSLVITLKQSLEEVAESFGVTENELQQIFRISLQEYLSIRASDEATASLFRLLSAGGSESNKLVDSFELLATLCVLSGAQWMEKIEFMFNLFDFNEKGALNVHELTLALRTIVSGVMKVADNPFPVKEEDVDKVAERAFECLSKQGFTDFLLTCVETMSFLACCETDLPTAMAIDFEPESVSLDVRAEAKSKVEPWREQLQLLAPAGVQEDADVPPRVKLELEEIFGRNENAPAVFCANGDILFAAGSMVVKIAHQGSRAFFHHHSGHVCGLDVAWGSDGCDMVASSDIGSETTATSICVWRAETLDLVVSIPTSHIGGCSRLAFSPSGDLLVSIFDNKNGVRANDATVAVFDWRNRALVYSASYASSKVFDVRFLLSDNVFAVCGGDEVFFYTRMRPSMPYIKQRGVFNIASTHEIMTSIGVCAGKFVVTGSAGGKLYQWEGRVCVKLLDSFSSPITCIASSRDCLHAATSRGTVVSLNQELEVLSRQAVNKHLHEDRRSIGSVRWHPDLNRLLVEQDSGLFCLPLDNGDDKLEHLALGHSGRFLKPSSSVLREGTVEGAALSCVAIDPRGRNKQIAVGFEARPERRSGDKSFAILSFDGLTTLHLGSNSLQTLTSCRYSGDGSLLAFGSEDGCIYVHKSTRPELPLLSKLRGHSSPVTKFDFGCDSGTSEPKYVRSNCSGEALFWTTHGKRQTPLSRRDTVWEASTCIYSPDLIGVNSTGDVASCCVLDHGGCGDQADVVVGDASGKLRVLSYPSHFPNATHLEYRCHSGSISKIESSCSTVFSASRGVVFKWKKKVLWWEEGLTCSSEDTAELERSTNARAPPSGTSPTVMQAAIDQMRGQEDIVVTAPPPHKPRDPWRRSIVPPSDYVQRNCALPDSTLVLERVEGYDGRDVKNNLHYLNGDDKTVVYTVGRTLITYNTDTSEQRFWTHSSPAGSMTCLAPHRSRPVIAVGLDDPFLSVSVIDLDSMKPLVHLQGHSSGVVCLDFDTNDNGRLIVSVGCDRRIVVHDWENATAIASSPTYAQALAVKFRPASASCQIVECGVCYVRLWTLKGCSLQFNELALDSTDNRVSYYSCLSSSGDETLVGTSTGHIIRFTDPSTGVVRRKAHDTSVQSILSSPEGGFVSSSSERIKVWSASFGCLLSVSTEMIGCQPYIISSIACNQQDEFLVGVSDGSIWRLSRSDGANVNGESTPFKSAPPRSSFGLDVSRDGKIATVDDSGNLILSNVFAPANERKVIDIDMPSRAISLSPDGTLAAVGFGLEHKTKASVIAGQWSIINVVSGQELGCRRDVRRHITYIRWHSGGERLAVGSRDGKVLIYHLLTRTAHGAVKVDTQLLSTIEILSFPTQFDWSRDGKYLRVNTESRELLYFEVGPGILIKEVSRLRDEEWDTANCVYEWGVQGLSSGNCDETRVTALDCCRGICPTVVSGDDQGVLKLANYPCTSEHSFLPLTAHSGPVTSVRFVPGGSHLVSVGQDAVMVWRRRLISHSEAVINESPPQGIQTLSGHQPPAENDAPTNTCCNAVRYNSTGRVIFAESGVVSILTNKKAIEAKVASSDAKAIIVWDSTTCDKIAVLADKRQRGVFLISFSSHDEMLVAVCASDEQTQTICIWRLHLGDSEPLLFQTLPAGDERVHHCTFTSSSSKQLGLFTLSEGGFSLWTEQRGALTLEERQQCSPSQTLTCGVQASDQVIAGTQCGALAVLRGRRGVGELTGAHCGPVLALSACPEGFISGGRDGIISIWSPELTKISSFDSHSAVLSIDVRPHLNNESTTSVLARTERGIVEISCMTHKLRRLIEMSPRSYGPSKKHT
ncbi:hypothetical protein THAOC_02887 [Thalassiosira oceanica]|uniref:EF-hand domain-containing protein n=1 Tax=Thalassiosira oceanica TaxID=159749 RepID=K0TD71_THAOC|nr:hypothetical protein THAOC_02887 [Thalassiosira oceanica]|eukprot:EJK75390.1 hypothetical protein THAOC_02887 [Thalassiosira oceanica]